MRILIIYFSFSGNNRRLAEYLAKEIQCDICPIIEKKRRTMLTIVLDMMFKRSPKIEAIETPISNYDHTILVAPIWDSKVANPMKTLIKREKNSLNNYSFISFCGFDRPGQKERITNQLTDLTGYPPKSVSELKVCELFPSEYREEVNTISCYHITRKDLSKFEDKIYDFLHLIQRIKY